MSILKDLARQRQLFARCPSCDGEFRLSEAGLFDATMPCRNGQRESGFRICPAQEIHEARPTGALGPS